MTFPPFTHIPGITERPRGEPPVCGHVDPILWRECEPFVRGFDLFHHGYYWEAHEEWEAVWNAAGRHGDVADFVKGLIQLAVVGVKIRQGRPAGVRTHALRAVELFTAVRGRLMVEEFMGLGFAACIQAGRTMADAPPPTPPTQDGKPVVLFDLSPHPNC